MLKYINMNIKKNIVCIDFVNVNTALKTHMLVKKTRVSGAYSRPLLGVTITPNLVPWVLRKIFSLKMIEYDISLGSASNQNAFFKKCAPKKHTHAPNV